MLKIEDLKTQNNYIHFQAIDQNFTVHCNTVGKIAVSISKSADLVAARKPRYRFDAMSIAINENATKRRKIISIEIDHI